MPEKQGAFFPTLIIAVPGTPVNPALNFFLQSSPNGLLFLILGEGTLADMMKYNRWKNFGSVRRVFPK